VETRGSDLKWSSGLGGSGRTKVVIVLPGVEWVGDGGRIASTTQPDYPWYLTDLERGI